MMLAMDTCNPHEVYRFFPYEEYHHLLYIKDKLLAMIDWIYPLILLITRSSNGRAQLV
jgi:hypothetical protein